MPSNRQRVLVVLAFIVLSMLSGPYDASAQTTEGTTIRPDLVPGAHIDGPKTVDQWFNTAAFARPAFGFFGTAGDGIIRGPELIHLDMGLCKDFPISGRQTIQFGSEFFKVFNHTNFNAVDTSFGSGTFGRVIGAAPIRGLSSSLCVGASRAKVCRSER